MCVSGCCLDIFRSFQVWIPFPELGTDLSIMYQDLGSLMFYIISEYVGRVLELHSRSPPVSHMGSIRSAFHGVHEESMYPSGGYF